MDRGSQDALGGSAVAVVSALTGERLCWCDCGFDDKRSLAGAIRTATANVCGVPYFAIDVFCSSSAPVDDRATWCDLGQPLEVQVIRKPKVLEWTEDLFAAVEAQDAAGVMCYLKQGQDPNCILRDSILCCAVETGCVGIVKNLLTGQACPNFIPPCCNGPLHTAVAYQRKKMVTLLLQNGANPNLCNSNGDSPLHLAMFYKDVSIAWGLLLAGADPLAFNYDCQSAFFCAESGLFFVMCFSRCADRVRELDVLARHLPVVMQHCSCHSL